MIDFEYGSPRLVCDCCKKTVKGMVLKDLIHRKKGNNMLKKCCFNCSSCHTACDNELVCRINGEIKKHMSIEQSENEYCELYDKETSIADPYD